MGDIRQADHVMAAFSGAGLGVVSVLIVKGISAYFGKAAGVGAALVCSAAIGYMAMADAAHDRDCETSSGADKTFLASAFVSGAGLLALV